MFSHCATTAAYQRIFFGYSTLSVILSKMEAESEEYESVLLVIRECYGKN